MARCPFCAATISRLKSRIEAYITSWVYPDGSTKASRDIQTAPHHCYKDWVCPKCNKILFDDSMIVPGMYIDEEVLRFLRGEIELVIINDGSAIKDK